jgi:hypothetical protein
MAMARKTDPVPPGYTREGLEQVLQAQLLLVQQAHARLAALAELVEVLAERAGVTEVGGVPPGEWLARRTGEWQEAFLRSGEDVAPRQAARLLRLLDDVRGVE